VRKILAIVVGLYLACGVAFGLATDPESTMCTATPNDEGTVYLGAVNDIPQIPWYCGPTLGPVDRLRWVAVATPAWLPLVIRFNMQ
jgi:hypothetical protein